MPLIRSLDALPEALKHGAVTIGNFDGVHRGHAELIQRLVAEAKAIDGPAVVFTFDPHPTNLLRPHEAPPPLTWTERKAELLEEMGVAATIAYPTDLGLLDLTPQQFFQKIIIDGLAARVMVEGPNFCFGRGRSGTIETLAALCRDGQVTLHVVPPVVMDGQIVSSSRVRQALEAGDVQLAGDLLGRPYRLRGKVVAGAHRGATLGFPTANLDQIDTLIPGVGVYAGWAWHGTSPWPAAVHIGPNPTFGEHARKVEVHLIDFADDLYDQTLHVDFLARLREVRPFASVEALKGQLARDVQAARKLAARGPVPRSG